MRLHVKIVEYDFQIQKIQIKTLTLLFAVASSTANEIMNTRTGISSVLPNDVIKVAQNPSMPRGLCAGAIASVTLNRISEV